MSATVRQVVMSLVGWCRHESGHATGTFAVPFAPADDCPPTNHGAVGCNVDVKTFGAGPGWGEGGVAAERKLKLLGALDLGTAPREP